MPPKKKVKEFSRPEVCRVRDELKKAVTKVAEQLGLTVTGFDRPRFNLSLMKLSLEFTVTELVASAAKSEYRLFVEFASYYGLKPGDYGKEVDLGNGIYKIVGLKPRATKNTIIVEKVKTATGAMAKPGQQYVVPHQDILRSLGDTSMSVGQYEVID